MMTYERCVQLGRWALLLALLPALAIVAMLAWPGESAGIAICVSAGAPPIAFVLALLAVTRWRRQFRGQPMPVCAVIAHLLAVIEILLAILVVLMFPKC